MHPAVLEEVTTMRELRTAVEQASVGRVFGAPIVQDGLTVVPVAKIGGGGGGGIGIGATQGDEEATGSGGGFGVTAKPLGVFVVRQGKVRWQPAIDVNKVILGGQLVAVAALLVLRAIVKARAAHSDAVPPRRRS